MRRVRRKEQTKETTKNVLYLVGSLVGIGLIAFVITFITYGNRLDKQVQLETEQFAELMPNTTLTNTQTASTQIGKTVEESKNEIQQTNTTTNSTNNTVNKSNNTTKETATKESSTKPKETKKTQEKQQEEQPKQEEKQQEETNQQELTFIQPVEGEVSKNYAKENLVYSETLQEWTTHTGVDIKAKKTTVVKAAAPGKVTSIKTDPRYGVTVIIQHQDGYETLYANLLTSEFVQVGEEVEQGQSIGTVGDTAAFEIADEPHLHFEIWKESQPVDPTQYLK